MENQVKMIESLITSTTEYAKTSFELLKLKAAEKTVEVVSSVVPSVIAFSLIALFLFFINLGLALWLGEVLGKTFYGFFVVGGFYGISGLVVYLVFFETIKKRIGNLIVKQLFK